ncbi:MAG: divalent-cation tolerance protein CutA [Smithellaceae bacterium]|nr:divalent-cation tolerance protein CutA [Smithellaceae bacterium]
MTRYIQVITTTESRENARIIAQALLDQRLAACVQLAGPLLSAYWWQGRQEESEEWQCLIKTREDLYPDVEREIKARHPYITPEIIALPIMHGSPDYLAWLGEELRAVPKG